ncbi:ankyrin repeat domain-containing protein 50-like, partial [Planoprotostelium fungivorum]
MRDVSLNSVHLLLVANRTTDVTSDSKQKWMKEKLGRVISRVYYRSSLRECTPPRTSLSRSISLTIRIGESFACHARIIVYDVSPWGAKADPSSPITAAGGVMSFQLTGHMQNGIISSYDVTNTILKMVMGGKSDTRDDRSRFLQFTILRNTCKIWKDLVHTFTNLFGYKLLINTFTGGPEPVRVLLPLVEMSKDEADEVFNAARHLPEIFEVLLADARVDPSVDDNFCLRSMSQYASPQVVKALLAHPRVDPSAGNNEAFLNASKRDRLKTVKLLLSDPRVDPSVDDNKAIHTASHYDRTETIRLLMTHPRVDPSGRDNKIIRNASTRGNLSLVELLFTDPRVDPSACDQEAIRTAAAYGYSSVVQLLLTDPRVDPSVCIEQIDTLSVMKLLLPHPSVDLLECHNKATRAASSLDHSMVVQEFGSLHLSYSTCLAAAASMGHLSVVELLLTDPRVDPSAANNEALIAASIGGQSAILDMLMAHPLLDLAVQDNYLIRNLCLRLQQLIGRPMYDDETPHSSEEFTSVKEEELDRIIQNIANEMLLLL